MSGSEKRIRFSLTLSEELIKRLESRVPEFGRSRQDVIERLLTRFWSAKTEIVDIEEKDRRPVRSSDKGSDEAEHTREAVGEQHRPTR